MLKKNESSQISPTILLPLAETFPILELNTRDVNSALLTHVECSVFRKI